MFLCVIGELAEYLFVKTSKSSEKRRKTHHQVLRPSQPVGTEGVREFWEPAKAWAKGWKEPFPALGNPKWVVDIWPP